MTDSGGIERDPVGAIPMRALEHDTAAHRWLWKTVHESRILDDMEDPRLWCHPVGPCEEPDGEGTKTGYGEMLFTHERRRVGTRSLRLTSPTTARPNTVAKGRAYGRATARRVFAGEDWGGFNRLSFWVYPTLPGFHTVSMVVELHNAGTIPVPDAYEREGLHYFLLQPDRWNQVVWEISHLARDRVVALDFVYRLQGSEPGAAKTVCFDIDLLELQRVDADHFEGWSVAPGKIAFCHTGYLPGAEKTGIISLPSEATTFELVDAANGTVRLSKDVRTVATQRGSLGVLDFSEVDDPGEYCLRAGTLSSGLFRIGGDIWDRTIWKTINFLFCERCGYPIPGGHDVCHGDWQCRHGDKRIVINGGWHDAGDLSQGLSNTADTAYNLFRLAQVVEDRRPVLSNRLIDEALWGLGWVRKTRFGDGYRCRWAVMDFWTDGIIGTDDDIVFDADNSPYGNFLSAMLGARAASALRSRDRALADRCRTEAVQDWQYGVSGFQWRPGSLPHPIVTAGARVLASAELFLSTGEDRFATDAFEFAGRILACQQSTYQDWEVPLCGYFCTDESRQRPLEDSHVTRYDLPAIALAQLCTMFPGHADWIRWYTAVALHSEYLRAVSRFTEPYRMLPAGIYRRDGSDKPAYREQVATGIRLGDNHVLRLFPVWYAHRGNNAMLLSQAKTLSTAMLLRRNRTIADLFLAQLAWIVGRNPFAQSLMYGEGYDFAPQYSAMCGDLVGGVPVGIQTRGNGDEPYWPATNCYNFKEVWMQTSARWLACMEDMESLRRAGSLSPGDLSVAGERHGENRVTLTARLAGRGADRCDMLSTNLVVDGPDRDAVRHFSGGRTVTWTCSVRDPRSPWIAVIVPDGDIDRRVEIAGPLRGEGPRLSNSTAGSAT